MAGGRAQQLERERAAPGYSGAGRPHVGMLSPATPETMQEYVRAFELGERLAGTFNARHGHTIAQPVCEGTLREHLREDLRLYFPDVFVPMAHAVQIAPPVEYCARWALEHACYWVSGLMFVGIDLGVCAPVFP